MAKDTRTAVVVVGVSLSQKGGETWRYTAEPGEQAKKDWPVMGFAVRCAQFEDVAAGSHGRVARESRGSNVYSLPDGDLT